jgi:predicted DNA-binding protein with PD1-like motif
MAKIYRIEAEKDLFEEVLKIAEEQNIKTARVEGIGGLKRVTIAYFNHQAKKYEEHDFEEFMEVTSMLGNISEKDGKKFLHLHANLGRKDMSVVGGHLIKATVYPFLELVITETENLAYRRYDPNFGLNVLEIR